jgi:hypothetical protein
VLGGYAGAEGKAMRTVFTFPSLFISYAKLLLCYNVDILGEN